MKVMLPILFSLFLSAGYSQIYNTMPPEAEAFYQNAKQKIKPGMISFIQNKAVQLSDRKVNSDSLFSALKNEKILKNINDDGCKTVLLLVLIECSNNADIQLKKIVLDLAKQNRDLLNSDITKPLLQQKSNLAAQVNILLSETGAGTSAMLNGLQ